MLSISACSFFMLVSAFCKAINCANSAFTLYRLLTRLGLWITAFMGSIITQREQHVQVTPLNVSGRIPPLPLGVLYRFSRPLHGPRIHLCTWDWRAVAPTVREGVNDCWPGEDALAYARATAPIPTD